MEHVMKKSSIMNLYCNVGNNISNIFPFLDFVCKTNYKSPPPLSYKRWSNPPKQPIQPEQDKLELIFVMIFNHGASKSDLIHLTN